MNELLFFTQMFCCFGIACTLFYYFDFHGLLFWVIVSSILASIQVQKLIIIFGIEATLGNALYGSIFLATDIAQEFLGIKKARQLVIFGIFALLVSQFFLFFATLFQSSLSSVDSSLAIEKIAFSGWRILLGSLSAFALSQSLDILVYGYLRKKFQKHLWLRNNVASIISESLDTLVFVLIAFLFVIPLSTLWQVFWSTLLLKWGISLLDTPFLYMARKLFRLKQNKWRGTFI